MAAIALGAEDKRSQSHPMDGGGFGQCYKLVEAVPEIKGCFDRIAKQSKKWELIINNWDSLEDSLQNGSANDTLKRLIYPDEYASKKKEAEESEKRMSLKLEREKSEIENPELNFNGVLKLPKLSNSIVNEWCCIQEATAAVKEMVKKKLLDERDKASTIEELANALKYSNTGYSLFNELGFLESCVSSETIKVLEGLCVASQYPSYIVNWIKENNIDIKPSFSVGDCVEYTDSMETKRSGVITYIYDATDPFYPCQYSISLAKGTHVTTTCDNNTLKLK